MDTNYFKDEPKKSTGFYLSIAALALFTLIGIGIDGDEFLQRKLLKIPEGYFYVIFAVDLLAIISLIGIAFFRKIAVFIFPAIIVVHFFMHQFYLSTFLYTDVTNIFLFVGVGLLMIIPKWKYFQ